MTTRGNLQIHPLSSLNHRIQFTQIWSEVVSNIGDVYYEIPYLKVAALNEDGEIFLCIYEHPEGLLLYSYVRRPLKKISFAAKVTQAKYDIITPFEYGGHLVQVEHEEKRAIVQADFSKHFTEYCLSQGIVTEFVRFHPLLGLHQGWESDYQLRKNCTHPIIDLNKQPETIWKEYTKNNRRDIKLAQNRGVEIEKSSKITIDIDINAFISVYYSTMNRYQAKEFYYFSPEYFKNLAALNNSLVSLYLAKDSHKNVVGGAIFLHSNKFIHYHLSGSIITNLCPINLLLHTVAIDMQKTGKKYLHLLGAPVAQPSLLEFKNKFSPARIDYYVGMRIYDRVCYDDLCVAWAEVNPEKAVNPPLNYFPLYRA